MVEDARFEDVQELPLRLIARDADDLAVISALLQDAVLPMKETSWQPDVNRFGMLVNRFGMLVNRFRWEDKTHAEQGKRPYERVQSMLVIDCVQNVSSMGVDHTNKEQIISILSVAYKDDKVTFILAGDGALSLDVECLAITIKDVTKPYTAISKSAPRHNLD